MDKLIKLILLFETNHYENIVEIQSQSTIIFKLTP